MMTNEKFLLICTNEVAKYFNEHADVTDGVSIKESDVYVVWYCKTLQNHKALLSTPMPDGMYYECTYNGDKNEIYLDAYYKLENRCISCCYNS